LSYNGQFVINVTRKIREADLPRNFFRRLVRLGVPVRVESNQR